MTKRGNSEDKVAEIRKSQETLRETIEEAKRLTARSEEILKKLRKSQPT